MPSSAVAHAAPDHVVGLDDVGPLLMDLVRSGPTPTAGAEKGTEMASVDDDERVPGEAAGYACPDCGGALWESVDGELVRYRCRTGHAYSTESLLAGQADELDAALWAALRVLEERAEITARVSRRMRRGGLALVAARFEQQTHEAEEKATWIRRALGGSTLTRAVASEEPHEAGAGV
jgi:two-component system chemotaxis response regulator CheB